MDVSTPTPRVKDPRLVAAGKKGMRNRWGPRRRVRLTELPPNIAEAIRLLVEQAETEAAQAKE